MNTKKVIFAGIALLIVIIAAGTLCSCKGRTMKNMEPTGDTVEVSVSPIDTDEDTAAAMSSSEAAI